MKKWITLLLLLPLLGYGQEIYVPSGSVGTSSNSNVGIGTSNPSEKLEVAKGNVKFIFDSQYANDPIIHFENDGVGADLFQTFYRWSGNSNHYWATRFEREPSTGFKLKMANATSIGSHSFFDAMVIANNGNVGIGVSSPNSLLHIKSSIQNTDFIIENSYGSNGRNRILLGISDRLWHIENDGNFNIFKIRDQTAAADRLSIDYNGYIGIGTNAPEAKLHIQGTPWTGIKIKDVTTSGGRGIRNQYLDGNDDGWIMYFGGHYTGQPLRFTPVSRGTAGDVAMTLFDNGNVGIGKLTPSAKLHVNGNIIATEVKVENVTGADFVFEEGYDLPTLEETEQFIKSNKHLPGIPSAAEMQEEGLTLGEMNMLLLQKIEEMTLHQIQQQKEISVLKTENDELKELCREIINQLNK